MSVWWFLAVCALLLAAPYLKGFYEAWRNDVDHVAPPSVDHSLDLNFLSDMPRTVSEARRVQDFVLAMDVQHQKRVDSLRQSIYSGQTIVLRDSDGGDSVVRIRPGSRKHRDFVLGVETALAALGQLPVNWEGEPQ